MSFAAAMELRGVSKYYPGGIRAIESLSLAVRAGELLVLTGPSGCGKTTTLRLLAGLEDPSGGEVWIAGSLANQLAPRDRGLGMVFQEPVLYPHLSVYENLLSGMRPGGNAGGRKSHTGPLLTSNETIGNNERLARDTGRRFRIDHLFERRPETLSGGEQQRVALGRALASGRARLLLDEPLSNVDFQLRVEIRRQLKSVGKELGTTMVYVTHDQIEALALGDRVAVMRQGRLQQIGRPEELFSHPKNQFVAEFLAPTPISFLTGRITTHGDDWYFEWGTHRLSIERSGRVVRRHVGQEVVLGVRPCAILVGAEGATKPSSLWGRVAAIEAHGDQSLTYLEAIGDPSNVVARTAPSAQPVTLVARFDQRLTPAIGARVPFTVDSSQLLWFAADSGSALSTTESAGESMN